MKLCIILHNDIITKKNNDKMERRGAEDLNGRDENHLPPSAILRPDSRSAAKVLPRNPGMVQRRLVSRPYPGPGRIITAAFYTAADGWRAGSCVLLRTMVVLPVH